MVCVTEWGAGRQRTRHPGRLSPIMLEAPGHSTSPLRLVERVAPAALPSPHDTDRHRLNHRVVLDHDIQEAVLQVGPDVDTFLSLAR